MTVEIADSPHPDMDPMFLALSRFNRRKWDSCIDTCTTLLENNPYDQAVWYLKARALTLKNWIDDTEIDEEGAAELLLDSNEMQDAPRPGTSLKGATTASGQGIRPVSSSGRPLSGFARPVTTRPGSGMSVEQALQSGRQGTARPVSSAGRYVRLNTASLLSEAGGPFINVDKIDLRKYATRGILGKTLCDYMLYHDHNPKRALELCALATQASDFKDWWWKARLGKCYYQLGLLRDAEGQFKAALRHQDVTWVYLELAKVYIRLDQPNTALEVYQKGLETNPLETALMIGQARVHDMLGDSTKASACYRKVLVHDASNIEAIASLASNYFYNDQPEMAMRYYRRLLQMGLSSTELWCNLGLCCFYASQYDMCITCFDRALATADDTNAADVWSNIGQVAIGLGDLGLATQTFKIAVSADSNHAEAFTNLGVLELRKGNVEQARSNFHTATRLAPHLFEPWFNGALLAFRLGDFEESFDMATKALGVYPDHSDSQELIKQLQTHFATL